LRVELTKAGALKGEVVAPADKSISHRAVIITSIARGKSRVRNFLRAGDTLSTVGAMRALGVQIDEKGTEMIVHGRGLHGLKEPSAAIDCGNSGTTMRLLSGVLAGNPFKSVLTGDDSLRRRPMARVIVPLSRMGADITAGDGNKYPPINIKGGGLKGIRYEMPIASAQVKSCLLLAGLYAEGITEVVEPGRSRDHTERMLPACGVDVDIEGMAIRVRGDAEPSATDIEVPGDFSSAAFFLGAALIVEGSEVVVRGVGLNPLRTGLMNVLKMMGADISVQNERTVSGEPVGDIVARSSTLRGVDIGGETIPSMIDEFPLLCVVASRAEGATNIRGAGELRVKESDRVKAMAEGLKAMGVDVVEHPDGLTIQGTDNLKGAGISSAGDHRVAMSFAVAALAATGETTIDGAEAADISFPGFYDTLRGLS
jgi:3-phosphoshikimate 1-carboxyvinyltransferase